GIVAAGPFEIAKAANGDTLLEVLPPSTWSWTGKDPSDLNSPSNFELIGGPGNQSDTIISGGTYGQPTIGDTVVVNNGTIAFPLDNTLISNTIFLTGTSELSFVGDHTGYPVINNGTTAYFQSGISYGNPTLDQASVITNDPPGTIATTTLNFAGYTVNHGDLEADAGNAMTISVAGTSELFNAGLIYANGGSILINGGTGIAGGWG